MFSAQVKITDDAVRVASKYITGLNARRYLHTQWPRKTLKF